jgi:hypothetical protein
VGRRNDLQSNAVREEAEKNGRGYIVSRLQLTTMQKKDVLSCEDLADM